MRTGKRRAYVIAICLASVLLLTHSVKTLSDLVVASSRDLVEFSDIYLDDGFLQARNRNRLGRSTQTSLLGEDSNTIEVVRVGSDDFLVYAGKECFSLE